MPNQSAEHHLVTVWNPSYAADAMEQHLGLLLHLAGEYDKKAIGDEQLYVWWGKVRSPNRQGPQANAEDIRRLATRDMPEVIAELKELRNVHYNDRPVSLFGGMVDLPLIVTRPDGRRFFDDDERDALTDGKLWAEFDAEHASAVAVLERDLRLNLLGD